MRVEFGERDANGWRELCGRYMQRLFNNIFQACFFIAKLFMNRFEERET